MTARQLGVSLQVASHVLDDVACSIKACWVPVHNYSVQGHVFVAYIYTQPERPAADMCMHQHSACKMIAAWWPHDVQVVLARQLAHTGQTWSHMRQCNVMVKCLLP